MSNNERGTSRIAFLLIVCFAAVLFLASAGVLTGGGLMAAAAPGRRPAQPAQPHRGQSPQPAPPAQDQPLTGDCDRRTRNLGIHDGYDVGNRISVRLCALPNLSSSSSESQPGSSYYVKGANGNGIVNAKVSKQYYELVAAAKKAGKPIAAVSTFRTMAHQQALCAANAGCASGTSNALVAKPGYSNHQEGAAIDFNTGHAPNDKTVAPGNPVWEWLRRHAARYGIHQYSGEAWHWSPSGG